MAALALLLVDSVFGQPKAPSPVFRPALKEIQSSTQVPIRLPSRLPSVIPENSIKLVTGQTRGDGYFIALYLSKSASNASYAAGFGADVAVSKDPSETPNVALSGGRAAIFSPVSCGGSCAPANLWWEEHGVTYQIQIRLRPDSDERDQQRILIETANSMVIVPRE